MVPFERLEQILQRFEFLEAKMSQGGGDIAALGRFDPVLALWVPFVLFAALIVWMYYKVAYVPGGQPIGALETAFAKLAGRLRKLFGRQRPARAGELAPAE